jgi:hypothetical protein
LHIFARLPTAHLGVTALAGQINSIFRTGMVLITSAGLTSAVRSPEQSFELAAGRCCLQSLNEGSVVGRACSAVNSVNFSRGCSAAHVHSVRCDDCCAAPRPHRASAAHRIGCEIQQGRCRFLPQSRRTRHGSREAARIPTSRLTRLQRSRVFIPPRKAMARDRSAAGRQCQ